MPSHNEYFNKYVSYFPTIGKQVRLGRGGSIQVIDKSTKEVTTYKNWDELNLIYGLFPITTDGGVSVSLPRQDATILAPVPEPVPEPIENEPQIVEEQPPLKFWTFGHPTRYKEIIRKFSEMYGVDERLLKGFNKPDWVYYFDSHKFLISTNNSMVIDILKNSIDWTEYKLPEPKRFTKEEIAGMIGMSVDSFIIVDEN